MDQIKQPTESFVEQHYPVLAVVVAITLVILAGLFVLWPQYQRLQTSGVLQHDAATERLAQERDYLNNLKIMETNFNQLDAKSLRLMDTIVPEQQSVARLFEEMELAFSANGFSLQSINLIDTTDSQLDSLVVENNTVDVAAAQTESVSGAGSAVSRPSDVQIINVTINVTTENVGYDNFKSMLTYLEQYERVIDLDTLSYSGAESSYTFVFNMYQRSIN